MQWLADLMTRVGPSGAAANAAASLAEDREAAVRIERFLARFDHPAGRSSVPVEPVCTSASGAA